MGKTFFLILGLLALIGNIVIHFIISDSINLNQNTKTTLFWLSMFTVLLAVISLSSFSVLLFKGSYQTVNDLEEDESIDILSVFGPHLVGENNETNYYSFIFKRELGSFEHFLIKEDQLNFTDQKKTLEEIKTLVHRKGNLHLF